MEQRCYLQYDLANPALQCAWTWRQWHAEEGQQQARCDQQQHGRHVQEALLAWYEVDGAAEQEHRHDGSLQHKDDPFQSGQVIVQNGQDEQRIWGSACRARG